MNSRYYDSETGRFISPDTLSILDETLSQINGLNLYLYCNDNPVMFVDPSGKIAITTIILLVCIGIGAVAGFGGAVYIDYKDDGQIFNGSVAWYDYLGATVLGGVIGGLVGYSLAPIITGLLTSTGVVGGGLALAGSLGSIGGTIAISTIGEHALVGTIAAVGAGTFGVTVMFAKTSKKTGKATSSNKPSWVNESMVDDNKTAQQNAKNILDGQYGPGNWRKGPKTEYNKIIKWIVRYLRYYRGR